ncbi:MAG: ATP-dependent DNA ligase, partial [Candidatus Thorarchaeota archaeon]
MLYEQLAEAYEQIETTSGSLDKVAIFSSLLKESDDLEIGMLIALTTGKLHPDWKGEPEIGIAERIAVQVVAKAASVSESAVKDMLRKTGDIGATGEKLLEGSVQETLFAEDPTITHVYQTLDAVAKTTGQGSSKEKVSKLVGLITDAGPREAKYILRTLTGDLRLGLGVMFIIDSLSVAFTGSKDERTTIENAFNVCSDLPHVAKVLVRDGIESVRSIEAEVGIPIRMMAAKKLSDAVEILEKTEKRVLVEYKYDGERVQIHKDGERVILFSRSQEKITGQYPDVVEYVCNNVKAKSCIMEGECVAVDPTTGKMRPFQELMRRRRKTDIKETMKEVPVVIILFDIIYLDGKDVSDLPMLERRQLLEKTIKKSDQVRLTVAEETTDPERLDQIFVEALDSGHEGIIAKAVHDRSGYQAGSRSWLWIKLKASYKEGMSDSVDLVIVGALHGRGKRTGLYGAILASAYDERSDTYPTVCKIGTGFTDDMLVEFKEKLDEYLLTTKDPKVIADLEADVWFEPVKVIEVLGDEITISPTHPAARDRIKEGGLA